ncbi:hypothetical protein AB7340_20540 [Providencia alcalifaciens]
MDYSKCNFVSALQISHSSRYKPQIRVNVKTGNVSISRHVNEGLPFVLIWVDGNKKAIRLKMSETEGVRVHYNVKTCLFHLTNRVHELILDGFDSAKSKVIALEKGDDGAWYGRF